MTGATRTARRAWAALFALAIALAAAPGPAAEKTYRVASDATWPPMEMVGEGGKIVGFEVDFLDAVAKAAGFKVAFENVPWEGIFAGLEAGRHDIVASSVTITDERRRRFDFSDAYAEIGQVLVVAKDEKAETLAALKGKTVGAQVATTGALEVQRSRGPDLKTYDAIGAAFDDLAAGRIAGVVCDEPVAAQYALLKAALRDRLRVAGKTFAPEPYGFVVQKGRKDLVGLLNKGIREVKAKKTDEKLRERWLR